MITINLRGVTPREAWLRLDTARRAACGVAVLPDGAALLQLSATRLYVTTRSPDDERFVHVQERTGALAPSTCTTVRPIDVKTP